VLCGPFEGPGVWEVRRLYFGAAADPDETHPGAAAQ